MGLGDLRWIADHQHIRLDHIEVGEFDIRGGR